MGDVFRDFSGRHVLPVARRERPRSLGDLVRLVREAEAADPPLVVAAQGSAWAFSAPAYTPGMLIDTDALNDFPAWLQDAVVQPPTGPEIHVAVEAGIKVRHLYMSLLGEHDTRLNVPPPPPVPTALLAGRRLAPRTLGGAGGQSLAGVVATGTHGGDVRRPPIADYVRAAVLVGSGGRVRIVQDPARPALDVTRLGRPPGLPADVEVEVLSDRAGLLDAIGTSVGRTGVVYAFVMAVEDETGRSCFEWRYPESWATVRDALPEMVRRARASDEYLQVAMAASSFFTGCRTAHVSRRVQAVSGDAEPARLFQDARLTREPDPVGVVRDEQCLAIPGQLFGVDHQTAQLWALRAGLTGLAVAIPATLLAWGAGVLAIAAIPLSLRLVRIADDLGTIGEGRVVGDVLARQLNDLGTSEHAVLLPLVFELVIASGLKPEFVRGPRAKIADFYEYAEQRADDAAPLYRGDSIELFFPVDARLPDTLDALLAVLEGHQRQGSPIGAYVALRFFSGSRSPLALTHGGVEDVTCSVEVSVLRGLRGNDQALEDLTALALDRLPGRKQPRGKVHWGQWHALDAAQTAATVGPARLDAWRRHLETLEGQSWTFLTPFAAARGLDVVREPADWRGWTAVGGGAVLSDANVVSGHNGIHSVTALVAVAADQGLAVGWWRDHGGVAWRHHAPGRVPLAAVTPSAEIRHDDTRLEVFAVGTLGRLVHRYQPGQDPTALTDANVKTRAVLAPGLNEVRQTRVASAQFADGHLEAYAVGVGPDQQLVHTGARKLDCLEDWPGPRVERHAVAPRTVRRDGRAVHDDAVVVVEDLEGRLWWRLHHLGNWRPFEGAPEQVGDLATAPGLVVASRPDGVWITEDTRPDAERPAWSPWSQAPVDRRVDPTSLLGLVPTGDGFWLFRAARDGRLLALRRRHGAWVGWTDLGGHVQAGSRPSGTVLESGRVMVVVRGGEGRPDPAAGLLVARVQPAPELWDTPR